MFEAGRMVIEAKDVSIRYITGDFKDIGLKEYVMRRLTRNYHVHEFWADRNISFSLEKGDMLGIIGANGAGKSTLLKAVSGIMVPTEGYIKTEGNVAALLELVSGFDPDLTVKENAFLRGALLGYTKEYMIKKYEEIISFSELQEFQDRPFKQLSSGMKSRLAFSIACLVDPDILILDEVLSVGDGAFREKSENKMREILSGGVTAILVSHSLDQVRNMCNKVLWIDKGTQVCFTEDVEEVCNAYEEFLITKKRPANSQEISKMAEANLERKAKEREDKQKSEQSKLMDTLSNGESKAAERAAKAFLNQRGFIVTNPSEVKEQETKQE